MNLIIKRLFLISVLLTAVLTACTPATETTSPASPSPMVETAVPVTPALEENDSGSTLANTQWTLESFGPTGAEMLVIDETAVTLQFDANGQAGGSGGCNSFGTTYQVQDNTISFGETTSTLMACTAEGVTEQEQAYLQALLLAHAFTQTENSLTILYDDGQGTLNFVSADSTSPSNAPDNKVPPQKPTGIASAPGTTSAAVRAAISERDTHYYVLQSFEGQEMAVEITASDEDVLLTILDRNGMPIKHYQHSLPSSAWAGQMSAAQQYYIHAVALGPNTAVGSFGQLCPGGGGCNWLLLHCQSGCFFGGEGEDKQGLEIVLEQGDE